MVRRAANKVAGALRSPNVLISIAGMVLLAIAACSEPDTSAVDTAIPVPTGESTQAIPTQTAVPSPPTPMPTPEASQPTASSVPSDQTAVAIATPTHTPTARPGSQPTATPMAPAGDVAPVIFDPRPGEYTSPRTVSLRSDTRGAEIWYTTDGTEPSPTNGVLYTAPIAVDESTTVRAVAISDQRLSGVTTAEYVIGLPRLDSPRIGLAAGPYIGPQMVTVTSDEPDATIRITLDGSEPTSGSAIYDGPVQIIGATTLRAIVTRDGSHDSEAVEAEYEIYSQLVQSDEPILLSGGDVLEIVDTHFIHRNDIRVSGNARLVIRNSRFEHLQDYSFQYNLEATDDARIEVTDSTMVSSPWVKWVILGRSSLRQVAVNDRDSLIWHHFGEDATTHFENARFNGTLTDRVQATAIDSHDMEIELLFPVGAQADVSLPRVIDSLTFPNTPGTNIEYSLNVQSSTGEWGMSFFPQSDITIRDTDGLVVTFALTPPWQDRTVVFEGLRPTHYDDRTWDISEDTRLRLVNVRVNVWSPIAGGPNKLILRDSELGDNSVSGSYSTIIFEDSTMSFLRAQEYVHMIVRNSTVTGDVVLGDRGYIQLVDSVVNGSIVEEGTGRVTQATSAPSTRLGSHMFVPVGESRSVAGLGALIETIHLTEPASLSVAGSELTAVAGGLSCLRYEYRMAFDENTVQTLCIVSVDETGDCSGQTALEIDLEQHLGPGRGPSGNANLLESGSGALYSVCRTEDVVYRLQQPTATLPPLFLTTVDALAQGPYSLGDDEMQAQRDGTLVTFSGAELRPPWTLTVSREVEWIRLTEDLRFEFNDEDCGETPSCSLESDTVRPGDILRISPGVGGAVDGLFAGLSEDDRDRFFQDRIGIPWSDFQAVNQDVAPNAFKRLAFVDVMNDLIPYFDGLYGLRDKGVIIGYAMWDRPIPFPYFCFPDSIVPGEGERCNAIEAALMAREAEIIEGLKAAGYTLWLAAPIDYGADGVPNAYADVRPHFSNFDGVYAGVGANSSVQVDDVPAAVAATVANLAATVGPDMPVVLTLNGPPITSQTGSDFCEADICPSDFAGMYNLAEAALTTAMDAFTPEQLRGFGVSMFEGSHFDIRQPYETFPGFSLNRVGETGFNNPILNVYLAQ